MLIHVLHKNVENVSPVSRPSELQFFQAKGPSVLGGLQTRKDSLHSLVSSFNVPVRLSADVKNILRMKHLSIILKISISR